MKFQIGDLVKSHYRGYHTGIVLETDWIRENVIHIEVYWCYPGAILKFSDYNLELY